MQTGDVARLRLVVKGCNKVQQPIDLGLYSWKQSTRVLGSNGHYFYRHAPRCISRDIVCHQFDDGVRASNAR